MPALLRGWHYLYIKATMGVSQDAIMQVAKLEKPKFEEFLVNFLQGGFKIERRGSGYKLIEDDMKDFQSIEDSILKTILETKKEGDYKSTDNLRRFGHHIAIMSSAKKMLPQVLSKYDMDNLPKYLSSWAKSNSLELKPIYVEDSKISFAVIPSI